jgi:hypothetical protein
VRYKGESTFVKISSTDLKQRPPIPEHGDRKRSRKPWRRPNSS